MQSMIINIFSYLKNTLTLVGFEFGTSGPLDREPTALRGRLLLKEALTRLL